VPEVSVIVPARDAAETIGTTLDALARQTFEDGYEVIVVDNGSTDDTVRIAERAGVRVLRRRRGEGPGSARNDGAAAAQAPALAFTDADCAPTPGWLAAGMRALQEADLVQGAVRATPGVPIGPFDRTLWVHDAWGLFETANLFVRRELFERLGGFGAGLELSLDGRPGAPFGEDVLFGWRAVRAGARTGFCDEALVHHAVIAGTAATYLAERRREGLFAGLVREVPELRDTFLYRRLFLRPRAAALWLALAGLGLAAADRRRLWALAAAPYLRHVARDVQGWGPRSAAVLAIGDAVALASRARGSVRARAPLG